MKLARVFCFLLILGSSAIAAHAQTNTDAIIHIDDPSCTPGSNCVVLEYTGPTVDIPNLGPPPQLTFLLPVTNPPGFVPDPPSPSNINCGSDVFSSSTAITNNGATEFFGCSFAGGTLTNDTLYSISDDGATSQVPLTVDGSIWQCAPDTSCTQDDISISFAPEPGTSLLFMTGILVFSLGGFARKRFGATSRT